MCIDSFGDRWPVGFNVPKCRWGNRQNLLLCFLGVLSDEFWLLAVVEHGFLFSPGTSRWEMIPNADWTRLLDVALAGR